MLFDFDPMAQKRKPVAIKLDDGIYDLPIPPEKRRELMWGLIEEIEQYEDVIEVDVKTSTEYLDAFEFSVVLNYDEQAQSNSVSILTDVDDIRSKINELLEEKRFIHRIWKLENPPSKGLTDDDTLLYYNPGISVIIKLY